MQDHRHFHITMKRISDHIGKFIKSNRNSLFIISISILITYPLLRTLEIAISTHLEISPDEYAHIEIIRLFSKYPLLIENSPNTYRFEPLANSP